MDLGALACSSSSDEESSSEESSKSCCFFFPSFFSSFLESGMSCAFLLVVTFCLESARSLLEESLLLPLLVVLVALLLSLSLSLLEDDIVNYANGTLDPLLSLERAMSVKSKSLAAMAW